MSFLGVGSTTHHSFIHETLWRRNQTIRFAVSGILGNSVFYGLDKVLFPVIEHTSSQLLSSTKSANNHRVIVVGSKWMTNNAASISFFVAYLLDIAVQHFLNALLVFGLDTIITRELYLSSLATTYTAYFGTLCGSTILKGYLLSIGISNDVAFWSTIALGSIVNYLVLTTLNAKVDECDISLNLKSHDSSNIGIRNNIAMRTTIINSKDKGSQYK